MNGSILGLVLVVVILILCFSDDISTETKIQPRKTASFNRYFLPQKQRYKLELQDDRWILKRNKILKRDNYRCVKCGYQHKLQVHHKYYEHYPNHYPVDAWDYPDTTFITLCDRCHKHEHEARKIKSYYRKFGVHYE